MTYGDGVSDIDLNKLLKFHKNHQKIATITAVHPPVRFGELKIKRGKVSKFEEKGKSWVDKWWLFCLEKKIFRYIKLILKIFSRKVFRKTIKRKSTHGL